MEKDVFKASDVARICRTSRQTVNRWLKNGSIRGFRPTRTADWKITRKELFRFMSENDIPMDLIREEEKLKVLIVDDEIGITKAIMRTLREDERLKVESANSGFTAGIKLESFRPDVVVLDIYLGDMDGRELFEYIRQEPLMHHVKVIGITGMLDEDKIQESIEDGFDAFLQKPFQMDELKKEILKTAVGQHM